MKKTSILTFLMIALGFIAKAQFTYSPSVVYDGSGNIVVHYHPYDVTGSSGDSLFRNYDSTLYVYTYLNSTGSTTYMSIGGWGAVGSTPADSLTKIDSNDFVWVIPNTRSFFGVPAGIYVSGLNLIFRNQAGTHQSNGYYIPVAEAPAATPGEAVTAAPTPIIDGDESVTVYYHPQYDTFNYTTGPNGDSIFKTNTGTLYVYSYIGTVSGSGYSLTSSWGAVGTTPSDSATEIDSNNYAWTIPDLRASFIAAGMPASEKINSLTVIFRTALGDTQTVNLSLPVYESTGPMYTTNPSPVVDGHGSVTIHFHPYWDTLHTATSGTVGDSALKNFGGTIFIYTGIDANPGGDWIHTNPTWAASGSYYAMTKVDSNDYTYTMSDLRGFYGLGADTLIDTLNVIFKDSLGTMQASTVYIPVEQPPVYIGPVVTTTPAVVVDSTESVTITFHPFWDTLINSAGSHPGDTSLRTFTGDMYIYTGVLPNPTPGPGTWIHTNTSGWGASDSYYKMTRVDSNTYTYTLPNLRAFYSLAATDTAIDSIAVIFTNGPGTIQTSNIFIPVVPAPTPAPVGVVITTNPSPVIDTNTTVVVTFHPYNDTTGGSDAVKGLDSMYVYTWLESTTPSSGTTREAVSWGSVGSTPALLSVKIDSNDYQWTVTGINSFYHVGADTLMDTMAVIFRNQAGTKQTENLYIKAHPATSGVITVTNNSHFGLQLMPNPATSEVTAVVTNDKNTASVIRVMNSVGQCVLSKDISAQANRTVLSLNNLSTGIYFVELTSGNNKTVQRLVKQ